MRRVVLASAVLALAIPAFASAETFSGSCDLLGSGDNAPPGAAIAPGYDFRSKGTCTGSLNGKPERTHEVINKVWASGLNVGPLPVADGALGHVKFVERKKTKIYFRMVQATAGLMIFGNHGGEALGIGTPNGEQTRVEVETLSPLSG